MHHWRRIRDWIGLRQAPGFHRHEGLFCNMLSSYVAFCVLVDRPHAPVDDDRFHRPPFARAKHTDGCHDWVLQHIIQVVMADICADELTESAQAVAAIAEAVGGEVLAVPTDVSDLAAVEALKEATYAKFGECAVRGNRGEGEHVTLALPHDAALVAMAPQSSR